MNYTADCHPSEEILTGCALDNADDELLIHLEECSQCSEFVEDIRNICHEIADLEEQQIPQHLHDKIMAIVSQKKGSKVINFIQNWYRNPFFYGIMTVLFVIIVYVIFIFLL
ncbi:MAG: DUF3379 domain-containing protein [Fibrobacter sp.]|jgi:hypothetical protein|nr:DUF3379 domain-containing protein [Fibrobacter sp.]